MTTLNQKWQKPHEGRGWNVTSKTGKAFVSGTLDTYNDKGEPVRVPICIFANSYKDAGSKKPDILIKINNFAEKQELITENTPNLVPEVTEEETNG